VPTVKTDVVIVGAGPAGTASAMHLAKLGIRPVIVERETFPRYHVGESMTGECAPLLRELGFGEQMREEDHPVKLGVKVFGPTGNTSWWVPVKGRDKDWKLFDQSTWQVRRSVFDKMMLGEAVARGALLVNGRAIRPLQSDDGAVLGVQVRSPDGQLMEIESEVLLDCSGQATFLANVGGVTGPKYVGSYDKQIAIFSQVTGAIRGDDSTRDNGKDNTLIFYQSKFHWAWFIPIDDEIVSVGVVVPGAYFQEKRESKRDFLVRELHELNAELKRRLSEIKLVEDVHVIPNYSYQVKRFCGKGFICIGDAHRFVDPIFSFGLFASLKEASLVAPVVKDFLNGAGRDERNPFADYQLYCEKGLDVFEDVIDTFWEKPLAFAFCVHHRYTDDLIDVLAGRVHERQPSEAVVAVRKLLQRERPYDSEEIYSVPIGSRFHPERAPIWEAEPDFECTEEWMIAEASGS
jgi:1H-pyrrole-2-carbonyl-[peptidyl-carrier protein] brominase